MLIFLYKSVKLSINPIITLLIGPREYIIEVIYYQLNHELGFNKASFPHIFNDARYSQVH